ncbi:MAG TPA: hypothetical protein VNS88_13765 [Nitrospiraceae bacterium]|nr:hypothetical protein [Nitrospiraceae bacterium]
MLEESNAAYEALRDENDSLRQECQELRAEKKEHEDFINEIGALLPPSYDSDDAMEAIVIRYLGDINSLGAIIARLTADYR